MAMNAPAAASAAMFDDGNVLEVELLHAGMDLEARSDSAMAGGANLAVVGSELIQFGRVERAGGRRYRLSRLLRGRRGTEWAASGHAAGEAFALLDRDAIVPVPLPLGSLGAEATLLAVGIGDEVGGVSVTRTATADSLRPPSPVHLGAERLASGDVRIGWTRRSRLGWGWTSGSDTPLAEERELYRVTLASGGASRTVTVSEPLLLYTAAEQAADGLAGPLSIDVVQIGTHSSSRPAQTLLS
jgi:hypothetical protein